MDANVYGSRVGPQDVEVGKDWYLTLSSGFAIAAGESNSGLFERISLPSGDALQTGSDGSTDSVLGGHVSGSAAYALSENILPFVGAQYQALGDVREHSGGKETALHLGGAVSELAGISVSF